MNSLETYTSESYLKDMEEFQIFSSEKSLTESKPSKKLGYFSGLFGNKLFGTIMKREEYFYCYFIKI